MKFARRVALLFIVFLLCFALSACGVNESIIGMWEVTLNSETKTIEFEDNGAYTVTNDDGDVEENGTYKLDGNKLIYTSAYRIDGDTRINLQEDSEDIMTFSISGRILTVTTKDGDSMSLTRNNNLS